MDSSDWDERYRSAEHLWSIEPNIFVADRIGPTTTGEGIDLAGGEGRNSIWLASIGWKMTCVDFSAEAIARGKDRSREVRFVVADVRTWEPDTEVDLVVIAYLHLGREEFENVVRRSVGWLRHGGEIFMIGHDISNLDEGHGGPQEPGILWDRDEIEKMISGLTVVESQVVRRPVTTEHTTEFALDTLVRARRPVGTT